MTELRVSDVNAAVGWWSRVLGCTPSYLDNRNGFALFEVSGGRVALKHASTPGGGTLHFEVERLPDGEVKTSDEGYHRVKLTDPDGNVVILFQWAGERRV